MGLWDQTAHGPCRWHGAQPCPHHEARAAPLQVVSKLFAGLELEVAQQGAKHGGHRGAHPCWSQCFMQCPFAGMCPGEGGCALPCCCPAHPTGAARCLVHEWLQGEAGSKGGHLSPCLCPCSREGCSFGAGGAAALPHLRSDVVTARWYCGRLLSPTLGWAVGSHMQ